MGKARKAGGARGGGGGRIVLGTDEARIGRMARMRLGGGYFSRSQPRNFVSPPRGLVRRPRVRGSHARDRSLIRANLCRIDDPRLAGAMASCPSMRSCPNSGPNPLKRPQIHHRDTENLDETINGGSTHPKMNGKTPFRPLNPTISRRPVTRVRPGSKRKTLSVKGKPFQFSSPFS